MAIKLGGDKGAVKRTYSSRSLGGVSGTTQSEGTTRSSVNPMNETADRDSYEGSGTGYRKTIHDQLEAIQATEVLMDALVEVLEDLKNSARCIHQARDDSQTRFHQHAFITALELLDALTNPELWDGTAVMRVFVGQAHLLLFPEGFSIYDFSPESLKLLNLDWSEKTTFPKAIDQIDVALERLEQLRHETSRVGKVTDAAMASMPHGQSARIQQIQTIPNVEFAAKTAHWIRSAMLANRQKAIEVQANRLSHQALHLVG